ncbi:MAG: beta-ketoacyl-ACP synthase II [Anaerolineae bacterium]|nr:beta-ketoacyl-ACP synthase II [Anaerolineae bacterium]MDW8100203.1 beta-ketoacyl-ACP synthase II [Anaerolineae bacterium]
MTAKRRRVVVTGLGAVTPLGLDVPTTWSNVLAGRSGVDRITAFDPTPYKTQIAAEVKDFDPTRYLEAREARRLDRFTHFAVAASQEAVADACLDLSAEDPRRVGIMIGSALGGIQTLLREYEVLQTRGPRRVNPFFIPAMLIDTAAGQVAIQFGVRGPNMAIVSACATGNGVIGEAAEIIRRGDADVILAGGSEAAVHPIALAGLNVMGALSTRNDEPQRASRPFDAQRDGFVIGEGAAILVLESLEHAQQRGARIYAEVLSYSATADAFHLAQPAEDNAGAIEAMQNALCRAGLPPEAVQYINAHGTSTLLNDRSETAAIKRVFGEHAYRLAVSSTKSMTGHLLGAAGALEAVLCVKALQDRVLPPTINYEFPDPECDLDYVPNQARPAFDLEIVASNAFGLGGHNACLLLRRWDGT